jgi:hypothetical protein
MMPAIGAMSATLRCILDRAPAGIDRERTNQPASRDLAIGLPMAKRQRAEILSNFSTHTTSLTDARFHRLARPL